MIKWLQDMSRWSIWKLVWGLFVLLMPLTSVPVIVRLVHSDVVAAPSALLLPLLIVISLIPFLSEKRTFAESLSPLVLFTVTALAATAISFFYQLLPGFFALP